MIEYIKGELAELQPTVAVIDCSGVGYELNITLLDYTALQGMREAKLFVHESIREDAHVLYGFLSREAREAFRLLIGVSGVGPNTARLILSSLTVDQLAEAVSSGSDVALKAVKGIGGKTAQRINVDLRDKIKGAAGALSSSMPKAPEAFEDAAAALVMLGFSRQPAVKALQKLFADNPSLTAEMAIGMALKML